MSLFSYLFQNFGSIMQIAGIHALLSIEGTVLGAIVAIPFGLWAYRRPGVRRFAAAVAETIQTIPSLALLAILMIWLGMGNTTLVATLFLYALMPMLHNTVEGLLSVDPGLVEIAKGLGMSNRQALWRVQVPLASPIIITGFRMALVTSIGIATVGVFIGAEGLGSLIYGGMQVQSASQIFAGAAPAALMAIIFDGFLAFLAVRAGRRSLRLPRLHLRNSPSAQTPLKGDG
ncbi:MAG: ABC transporter permease [Thermaerobacter sp.]|nr:ABC transporter permease [Thermaerobacter sp.]